MSAANGTIALSVLSVEKSKFQFRNWPAFDVSYERNSLSWEVLCIRAPYGWDCDAPLSTHNDYPHRFPGQPGPGMELLTFDDKVALFAAIEASLKEQGNA